MRQLSAAAAVAFAAACSSPAQPPVAGTGITIAGTTVNVDTAKVPDLATCETDSVVVKSATSPTGWACAAAGSLAVGSTNHAANADVATKATTAENALLLGGQDAGYYLAAKATAVDSAKLGGAEAGAYALKTDTAPDSALLGGKKPSDYLGAMAPAVDSAMLGGVAAAGYVTSGALTTVLATKLDAMATATNASQLGGVAAANYVIASAMTTALATKLDTAAAAADSAKLGGVAPSGYLGAKAQAADSAQLGGKLPSAYLGANAQAVDSASLGTVAAAQYVKQDSATSTNVTLAGTLTLGGNVLAGTNREVITGPNGVSISTNGSFCGYSTNNTQGTFSFVATGGATYTGYRAAKLTCETACGATFAHMCSPEEMVRSAQLGTLTTNSSGNAWVSSGKYSAYLAAGYSDSDCNGWTTSSGPNGTIGSGFTVSGTSVYPNFYWCSGSYPLACCK